MLYFEDDNYYYVWKPHGIPSTYGNTFSFVEQIEQENPPFFQQLATQFTRDDEYGLVNRLDNDTAGLLYFAKSPEIKELYKNAPADTFTKIYICDVRGRVDVEKTLEKLSDVQRKYITRYVASGDGYGGHLVDTFEKLGGEQKRQIEGADIPLCFVKSEDVASYFSYDQKNGICIAYPIMHSNSSQDRMMIVSSPDDERKGRGEKHIVETILIPIAYDEYTNTTQCFACIHRGTRHQIRIHTAAIGYPIIGDQLYNKHITSDDIFLHLWSIALEY